MTPDEIEQFWRKVYIDLEAFWLHSGHPRQPHALLTKGMHSNGYANSERVIEDPTLLDKAAHDLVFLLQQAGLQLQRVTRVVGPAMGAIELASHVGRHISLITELPCRRAWTQKPFDDESRMIFNRTQILSGDQVLMLDDVITTGGSLEATAVPIIGSGGILLPFVASLVNRSNHEQIGAGTVVSLIRQYMPLWTPEQCPLCKIGSKAIRPREYGNWKLLNAKYE